ncbi:MAG TPA: hypothetical protein VGM30_19660 [Puia sp.]|jgi:hypothetical protein
MSFVIDPVKRKPRLLTVSESCRYHPRITISGGWIRDWGFDIGDRVFLLKVTAGEILIRIGTTIDDSDITKYCHQTRGLSKFQIRDSPYYRLSPSSNNFPEIVITGAWLSLWGFTIGDRVSLTWLEKDHILMKVVAPSSEWQEVLQKKKLERQVAFATAMLERHRTAHPSLYGGAPKPIQKRVLAFSRAKQAQSSLFDELIPSTPAGGAGDAARSANAPVSG